MALTPFLLITAANSPGTLPCSMGLDRKLHGLPEWLRTTVHYDAFRLERIRLQYAYDAARGRQGFRVRGEDAGIPRVGPRGS